MTNQGADVPLAQDPQGCDVTSHKLDFSGRRQTKPRSPPPRRVGPGKSVKPRAPYHSHKSYFLLCSDLAPRALFSKPGLYVRSSLLSARPALHRSPGRGSPLSSSPRVNALTTEACSRGVEQPEIRLIYHPKFHAIHTDQDLRCFSSVGGSSPGSPPSSSMKMRS